MKTVVFALALGLAACQQAGPNLTSVMSGCGYESKPFVIAWPCVRAGAAKAPADSDLKGVYIASGDFVAEQVGAGKMSDAEAKLAMAQVRQRARDAADTRGAMTTADAVVLSGILNRPQPVQAPVFTAPRTLNCWRLGNNVQCY